MARYTNRVMRLMLTGCANRPFYRIVVGCRHKAQHAPPIDDIGSFDPMPNDKNEKLVALDIERVKYHIATGCEITTPVARLLGLAGILPEHPTTYIYAKRQRKALAEKTEQEKESESQNLEEETEALQADQVNNR